MKREEERQDLNDLGTTIMRMLKEVLEKQDAMRHTVHMLANSMGTLSNRLALIEIRYRKQQEKEEPPKTGEQSR